MINRNIKMLEEKIENIRLSILIDNLYSLDREKLRAKKEENEEELARWKKLKEFCENKGEEYLGAGHNELDAMIGYFIDELLGEET